LKEQYPEKKAIGRPRPQYLKQVARNTAADRYTEMKEWLATVPDGKLTTNQKTEGLESFGMSVGQVVQSV
jgi:hypothetical protein